MSGIRGHTMKVTLTGEQWAAAIDRLTQRVEAAEAEVARLRATADDAQRARSVLAPNFANRGEHETQPLADIARTAIKSHQGWFDRYETATANATRAWRMYQGARALLSESLEALISLAGSPAEMDDPRIGYLTMQVDRGDLGAARVTIERLRAFLARPPARPSEER